jgi:hypothetical protein
MEAAHWQTPDDGIAERAADRRPVTARRRRGDDHSSTIELRLYLPRRAWQFTFTRKRATHVEFRHIVHTGDDRNQIAAPSV